MCSGDWSDKNVLVVGLGKSGYASALFLTGAGARVAVVDSSEKPLYQEGVSQLEAAGVEVYLGVEAPRATDEFDLIVASPGVPPHAQVLIDASRQRVPVWSEIELGFKVLENPLIAVTGTNGKTTTTEIIATMLERGGFEAKVCGNIGNPLVGLYGRVSDKTILVVEVSSFQLRNIVDFRPEVAVLLNIAPDHFDWHPGFYDYYRAKARLVENQLPQDLFVYNRDDEWCSKIAAEAKSDVVGFSIAEILDRGVWLEDDRMKAAGLDGGGAIEVIEVERVGVPGRHNLANIMAAAAVALARGVPAGSVSDAISGFSGLEHRVEFVDEVRGVAFYNDSKATNPHAAVNGLDSFDRPKAVILGGRNKGLDFTGLVQACCSQMKEGRVKGVVLFGEASHELEAGFKGRCESIFYPKIVMSKGVEDAVFQSFSLCGEGEIVLFTPGCSSFDLYKNYKERGRAFKKAVKELKGTLE